MSERTRGSATDEALRAEVLAQYEVALAKKQSGKRLSQADQADLRRGREALQVEYGLDFLRNLPQVWMVELLQSPKKVLNEWKNAGMPCNPKVSRATTYDAFKVIPWLKERWLQIKSGGDGVRVGVDARARKDAAKAELAELELNVKLGELVYASEARSAWGARVTRARQELLALPSRVAVQLEGRKAVEVQGLLDREIRQVLEGLSNEEGQATDLTD